MKTDGGGDGKADAGNGLLQREADAFREVQAGQSLVDATVDSVADSVPDESTRKSLSSGESEFCVLNLGCAGVRLVMNYCNGMHSEHITLTGLPEIVSDSSAAISQQGRLALGLVAMVVASSEARMESNQVIKSASFTTMRSFTKWIPIRQVIVGGSSCNCTW